MCFYKPKYGCINIYGYIYINRQEKKLALLFNVNLKRIMYVTIPIWEKDSFVEIFVSALGCVEEICWGHVEKHVENHVGRKGTGLSPSQIQKYI